MSYVQILRFFRLAGRMARNECYGCPSMALFQPDHSFRMKEFSAYFINHTKNAHTDIPRPNFQEYRRKSVQDLDVSASKTIEKRKSIGCVTSFVGGAAALYGMKSHALHYVRFLSASRDVLAESQTEVSLRDIPEGKVSVVKWRGRPIFVSHRTQSVIDQERAVDLSGLRDPQADQERIQRPEWLVVVGICTHLGCVPIPNAGIIPAGFYCPCHGSHYDAAGRIRKGPAPTNLEIPEYKFVDNDNIVIG